MRKNELRLAGKINEIKVSHEAGNTTYYKAMVETSRRNSERVDVIPVVISEKLLYNNEDIKSEYILVEGDIRTLNQDVEGKRRLLVFAYAKSIKSATKEEADDAETNNIVEVEGYTCRRTSFRETRSGKKVADFILAHNRSYNKESYIPTIVWGMDAEMAKNFKTGEKLHVLGRFQSRSYKDREDKERVTYELSSRETQVITD